MPRYEFVKGSSSKFWEIEREGNSFTTTYGKIGTDGKSTKKTFADVEKTTKEYDKIVASKVKKGYALVSSAAPSSDEPSSASAIAGSNEDLERAIFDDPKDGKAWLVYGDWLQDQGDARGEIIALSLSKTSGKKARIAELAKMNEGVWLGDLGPSYAKYKNGELGKYSGEGLFELEYEYGFLSGVRITDSENDLSIEDDFGALLKSSAARFLQSLTVGLWNWECDNEYETAAALLANNPPVGLRYLHLGDFEYPDESEISWTEVGEIGAALAALPRLEVLKLQGSNISLSKFEHPTLRELQIHSGGCGGVTKDIGTGKCPKLEKIEIWLGREEYGGYGPASDFDPMLAGGHYPALKHLGLMNAENANEIAERVAPSKLMAQLETLDLSMGAMNDEGAQHLLDHAANLKRLTQLSLDENFISDAMLNKLREEIPGVVGASRVPDEWDGEQYFFTVVGE